MTQTFDLLVSVMFTILAIVASFCAVIAVIALLIQWFVTQPSCNLEDEISTDASKIINCGRSKIYTRTSTTTLQILTVLLLIAAAALYRKQTLQLLRQNILRGGAKRKLSDVVAVTDLEIETPKKKARTSQDHAKNRNDNAKNRMQQSNANPRDDKILQIGIKNVNASCYINCGLKLITYLGLSDKRYSLKMDCEAAIEAVKTAEPDDSYEKTQLIKLFQTQIIDQAEDSRKKREEYREITLNTIGFIKQERNKGVAVVSIASMRPRLPDPFNSMNIYI